MRGKENGKKKELGVILLVSENPNPNRNLPHLKDLEGLLLGCMSMKLGVARIPLKSRTPKPQ